MLFAQAATEVTGYLNFAVNAGALGILGYFFLFGLPKLFDQVNANQKMLLEMIFGDNAADRAGFEMRTSKLAEEIKLLRESQKCRYQP